MKPILFNTEMVRAILDGRKTVTRRPVKFKPGQNPAWSGYIPDGAVLYGSNNIPAVKAPYQPNDILYVRETWAEMPYGFVYRADGDAPEGWDQDDRWRPSIHMPREAARLFLRVKAVRVERLRDITAKDIRAEGTVGKHFGAATRGAFADLWDSTIKSADLPRYGWEADPWVWVIAFERISVVACSHAAWGA